MSIARIGNCRRGHAAAPGLPRRMRSEGRERQMNINAAQKRSAVSWLMELAEGRRGNMP